MQKSNVSRETFPAAASSSARATTAEIPVSSSVSIRFRIKEILLLRESISVNVACGNASLRGIPGNPAPVPTSIRENVASFGRRLLSASGSAQSEQRRGTASSESIKCLTSISFRSSIAVRFMTLFSFTKREQSISNFFSVVSSKSIWFSSANTASLSNCFT